MMVMVTVVMVVSYKRKRTPPSREVIPASWPKMCLTGQDTFARLITRIISSCYGSSLDFLPMWRVFSNSPSPVKTFTCTYSPDSNIEHTLSQYLVSNVFSIGAMAIAMEIGYLSVSATAPCLSPWSTAGGAPSPIHFLPNPATRINPHVLDPPFSSVAFVVWVSPQLFCMGTRSVFIAVPASIVNVLPSVHWIPLFPPPPLLLSPTQLCIEFSSCFLPPQPAGGQNHDSIVWSRFRRDYHRLSRCYSETSPPHLAEVWISSVLTASRLRR